jgi:hypothetical protein
MNSQPRTSLGHLWRCAYRSQQVTRMTRADVAALLRKAQMRNVTRDITGLLLLVDNRFLHFLEGPEVHLRALIDAIARDPRHSAMNLLFLEPADGRLFGGHSMAFSDWSSPMPLDDPMQRRLLQMLNDPVGVSQGQQPSTAAQMGFWRQCATALPA